MFIDQKGFEYSKYKEDGSYVVKELSGSFGEPLKIELEAFLRAVRNDEEPPITGEDGLKALEVAIECLK